MKSLDELTAHCIRCGFCLESCPTFQLTGEETESPRGRIYLVRSADEGKIAWQDAAPHLDRCLGCRACETACPSGVQYGEILEIARDHLEQERPHRTRKALLRGLSDPKRVRMQLILGQLLPARRVPRMLSKLLSGQAPEANRPQPQVGSLPPLDESGLPAVKGEVYLLEGCVMRVLFPRVHQATRRLLRRVGLVVRELDLGCCGSLHLHAGYLDEARIRAQGLVARAKNDLPIIVDSAGCGSTMKSYGDLWGLDEPQAFDASEFLFANGLTETLRSAPGFQAKATYHDACHLAHGQGIRSQPRELLRAIPGLELIDLSEADTCCGSAGIYNLTQPKLARQLLERKWANIEATGADIVAMGNPGCHAWIAQAAEEHRSHLRVLHTMELLEAAFIGLNTFLGGEHGSNDEHPKLTTNETRMRNGNGG